MRQITRHFFCIFLSLAWISPLQAGQSPADNSYEELFSQGIEESSNIAAEAKLNIDFIPAFVTVLHHDELSRLGIDTVFEAMALVPGVELFMEATGAKQLIFRGVKEKGKVKLLIDGIDINNNFRGSVYYYYDFPIELVDRIEVIRGPGAVLYGSGAMSGVVNIVTKSADESSHSNVFGSLSSHDTYKGGMLLSNNINDRWHLALDGYYTRGDKEIDAGPDKKGAFGESDESVKDYSVGLSARDNHLQFISRFKRSQDGIAFGGKYYNFVPNSDKKGIISTTFLTELQYVNQLLPKIDYKLKAGYSYYNQDLEARAFRTPAGYGMYRVDYSEDKLYADLSLLAEISSHEIIGGVRFADNQQDKGEFKTYIESQPEHLLMPDQIIKPDRSRQVYSLYFNDNFQLNDALEFSFGLRYDFYSEIDDTFNPRLGLVYRLNDELNFKAMYSRAYRVPSWIELYINVPTPCVEKNDLDAETSDTIELGLVFNSGTNKRLGFNVYWSQLSDLIVYSPADVSYTQGGRQTFWGGEFFLNHSPAAGTEVELGLSYVYGMDEEEEKLPDIAGWMGNFSLMHTFAFALTSTTRLRFVSDRHRASGDDRDNLDGYIIIDETLSRHYRNFTFIAGVKNIFNHDVRFPAPANSFEDDYPRDGRTFIFKISCEF